MGDAVCESWVMQGCIMGDYIKMAGRRMDIGVARKLLYKYLHTLLRSNRVCIYLFNSLKMLVAASAPCNLLAQCPAFAPGFGFGFDE